jgi:hypothetical protein
MNRKRIDREQDRKDFENAVENVFIEEIEMQRSKRGTSLLFLLE